VVAIFAREITPGLTSLVKAIDKASKDNSDAKLGSFVVVMTDDDKTEKTLEALADKEKIKQTVLCIDSPKGPEKWKLSKDAGITVMLYVKNTVKENFVHTKDIDAKGIEAVVAGLKSILPEAKKDGKDGDK